LYAALDTSATVAAIRSIVLKTTSETRLDAIFNALQRYFREGFASGSDPVDF
jgi:hypothetical protein